MNARMIFLMVVMGVLLVARFVVVPVFEWQDETLQQIALENKRLDKLSLAAENLPEVELQLGRLQQANERLAGLFYPQQPVQAFQLQRQKQLEQALTSHNLTAQSFGWSEPIAMDTQGVTKYRANLQLNGRLVDFVNWHMNLETSTPLIQVQSMTLRRDRRSAANRLGRMTAIIEIAVYSQGGPL